MKRTIRALDSHKTVRLGDQTGSGYPPISKHSLLESDALEQREDRTVLLEALIYLRQAKRRPEKAKFLDWNDVKDRWE